MQVGEHFLAAQNVFQALKAFVGQNSDFVRKILFELRNLRRLDRLSALVLFLPFPGEDLYIDDHALDTRRAVERSIAHVAGLLAKDRAQHLLVLRDLYLTFWSELAPT